MPIVTDAVEQKLKTSGESANGVAAREHLNVRPARVRAYGYAGNAKVQASTYATNVTAIKSPNGSAMFVEEQERLRLEQRLPPIPTTTAIPAR